MGRSNSPLRTGWRLLLGVGIVLVGMCLSMWSFYFRATLQCIRSRLNGTSQARHVVIDPEENRIHKIPEYKG